MSSKQTRRLIQLVKSNASEQSAAYMTQELIRQGADIKAPVPNGSMIDSVVREMNRLQELGLVIEAQHCGQLIRVLQDRASDLLANAVLSNNNQNLNELTQLIQLHANCYQSERFGSLGLLGELLKQEKIPIPLNIVQILVDHYDGDRLALMNMNDQKQTCLTLSKNNPSCPIEVQQFLQNTFDIILNQIPFTHPQIDVNEVAQWIYRGANPEAVDEKGNTVLCNAVIVKNQQLVEKLLGAGCDIAHKNQDQRTPLQIAKNTTPRNPQLEAILKAQIINLKLKQLIETKKNLLTINEVNALLEEGAKINAPMANESTPLHLLIANNGTPDMITAFVNDFHADSSIMDVHGYRPVETCILLDQEPFSVLRTFLRLSKVSTDTYYNIKLKQSILQFAREQQRPDEVVKIIQDALNLRLWNLVARTNTNDEHNRSLLAEYHQLIIYGAQIEHKHSDKDYQDWTILHLACKISTKRFVQYLIKQKADHTSANGNGDGPLSIAAEYGHLPIVQYLHRSLDMHLNVSNNEGQTPLHLAAKKHHLDVVRYLVLWGADHQAKNAADQTPIDLARMNVSKNKKDQTLGKQLVDFLEQLVYIGKEQNANDSTTIIEDLDQCELVEPIPIEPIQITSVGDEEALGLRKPKGSLFGTINDNLFKAASQGSIEEARRAIADGANICHRKDRRNAYEVAIVAFKEYHSQCMTHRSNPFEMQTYEIKKIGCQAIIELIQITAYNRLLRGIDISNAYHVVAFHRAGAPLSAELLSYSCAKSDNVQIIDYLISTGGVMFQAMFDYSTDDSPYRIARKNNFNKVASYLKYRLSMECTKAVEKNDTEYVRKLVRAGASVDMHDTNNLRVALAHQNAELVEILCKNGAKMPIEWCQSDTILLPESIANDMDSNIALLINRSLVDRRLRLAAAQGDFSTLTRCLHLSADINSENCYGSTALLCSIQHGNYFAIVHALVSRGGSILHSNEDEPMSMIALAKKQAYTKIATYLSEKLNSQFLTTIQQNDVKSVMKFESLGPDFNYQDEQKRTALHHAVQYHGIELVKWLCASGSMPTLADIDGNYPITEASEKGDYAVVEFFATKYSVTKQQKNKAGLTALEIAEKLGFAGIIHFLKTGQPASGSQRENPSQSSKPKHRKEDLINAARNGRLQIIKEFINDPYQSRDEKREICLELLATAKAGNHHEVVRILQNHYDELSRLPSNIGPGGGIQLSQGYEQILRGFLTGIGQVIAESPVVLNPADPNTYRDLFSHLTANHRKQSEKIRQVSSESDAKKLSEEDLKKINEKLVTIDLELNKIQVEKAKLDKDIQVTSDQLKEQKELTAIQRADLFKQRDEHKKQLAVYECSVFLYQRQQEATLNRRETIRFIHDSSNMYLFFRTVENLLQSLFHGAFAARSGLLSTKPGDPGPISLIPFAQVIGSAVKSTIATLVSKLNEREQKKEHYNISTYGNIEELNRLASDTAGLLTLYYKEQIESIDTENKIKGSNIFNEKIHWIREKLIGARPEGKEELAVVIVAEYITAWVMETLKGGKKDRSSHEPLPQKLWFSVAKTNCLSQSEKLAMTDILGSTAGRQKIPIKISRDNADPTIIYVQLRYLIGCVSIVTEEGEIYQYNISEESSKKDLDDLEIFGYVYVSPFLYADQSVQSIVKERKLVHARRDDDGRILNKLKDIERHVSSFQDQADQSRQSAIVTENARQVAEILHDQHTFVDPQEMKRIFDESQEAMKINYQAFQDVIEEKLVSFQTTLNATGEQLQQDLLQAKRTLVQANDEQYQMIRQKINGQLSEIEQNVESQITRRLNTIEKQLKAECDEMQNRVKEAQVAVDEALRITTRAVAASEESARHAEEARLDVMKLAESTEQQQKEFQSVMNEYQVKVEQTIAEQRDSCEKAIIAVQIRVEEDFERVKVSAEQTAVHARELADATADATERMRRIERETKRQLEQQKETTHRIQREMTELRRQNKRLIDEAEEAKKQAKRAADTTIDVQKRFDEIQRR